MSNNIINYENAKGRLSYKRRNLTAYKQHAIEVILIADDPDTRDLIRRCLNYGSI